MMIKPKRFLLNRLNQSGNSMVELAIVLPLFMLMILAISDFSRHAKSEYITILASRFAAWGAKNDEVEALFEKSFPNCSLSIFDLESERFVPKSRAYIHKKASSHYRSKIVSDDIKVESECIVATRSM